jgi:hypothetical protein
MNPGENSNTEILKREFFVGLMFFAAALIFLFFSLRPEGRATLFPTIISSALIIFSLVFSIQQLFLILKSRGSKNSSLLIKGRHNFTYSFKLNIFLLIIPLITLGFIMVLPLIGFEASGFVLMFAIMLIINRHLAVKKIHYAVLVPIILNLIFKYALNIHLPGTWELLFNYA